MYSVNFCYPFSELDLGRCHGQLQAIKGRVLCLKKVIANISVKPEVK